MFPSKISGWHRTFYTKIPKIITLFRIFNFDEKFSKLFYILRSTEYVPTPDVNNGKTWGRIQTQSFLFNAHHKYVPWNDAILQIYLRTKTEKHMKYCIFKTNHKKSSVQSSTILLFCIIIDFLHKSVLV
jgi:hypothetical protein